MRSRCSMAVGTEIRGIDYSSVGYIPDDSFSVPGGPATLTIRNGAQVTLNAGGILQVGAGGAVGGRNGTINGNVDLVGQCADRPARRAVRRLHDQRRYVRQEARQQPTFMDVGSAGDNDLLTIDDYNTSGGQLAIALNVLGGYRFTPGEMRTLVDFVSGSGNRPTWSVNGQHADFAFYGGTLASDPDDTISSWPSTAV